MAGEYEVRLENIFEGPMDLLVYLIKKNEVDIHDIPIALITEQYLAYLEWMRAMSIDFAGDFILMAATLTHIKSKMLLPVSADDEDEEAEDPRMEIARPLAEYLKMQSMAEQLRNRPLLGQDLFAREPNKADLDVAADPEEGFVKVGLFELIDAFRRIMENLPRDHQVDLSDEKLSVKDRIAEIVAVLEQKQSVTLGELFTPDQGKPMLIVTFLAILEMAKLGLVEVSQQVQTGIIRLFYQ